MVDNDRLQVREPKVLRVRVVAPTAAVAAFSTLTLVGVAALGFASGDLRSQPSSNDAGSWIMTAPDTVQAVETLSDQAVATPGVGQGAAQGGSSSVVPPTEAGSGSGAVSSGTLPVLPGAGSGAASPSAQGSTGTSAGGSLPVVSPPQQAGAAAPTGTGELTIHLSLNLLASTRQSVASNLRAGLRATLGPAKSEDLQQELSSSSHLDDAVTNATSTAVESSLRAAQAVSGPKVAPAEVSQAAALAFMRVLPDELTRTVHPVVMAALAKTGNEVNPATLDVVLSGATDDAAKQLSDLALPQVQTQVVALVETTQGDGVAAPTATVTTEPPVSATTTTEPSTDSTVPSRASDTQTPDPVRPSTTKPEPTDGGSTTEDQRGTGQAPPASQSAPTSDPTSPTSVDPTAGEGNRVVVVPSTESPAATESSSEPTSEPSSEPSGSASTEPSAGRPTDTAASASEPAEPAPAAPSTAAGQADDGEAGTP